MWPLLGGLLNDPSFELLMPGQDTPYTVNKFGNGIVYAGMRLNNDGSIDLRGDGSAEYTELTSWPDSWIHSDARGIFNINNYEWYCNFISGDTVSGDNSSGVWTPFSTTANPEWYVVAAGSFDTKDAQLIIGVRQTGVPASTKSGTINLSATEFGL